MGEVVLGISIGSADTDETTSTTAQEETAWGK